MRWYVIKMLWRKERVAGKRPRARTGEKSRRVAYFPPNYTRGHFARGYTRLSRDVRIFATVYLRTRERCRVYLYTTADACIYICRVVTRVVFPEKSFHRSLMTGLRPPRAGRVPRKVIPRFLARDEARRAKMVTLCITAHAVSAK